MAQEMIAAGPAAPKAPWAPNNQPDPMIEPSDAQMSPMKPISRLSPGRWDTEAGDDGDAAMANAPCPG